MEWAHRQPHDCIIAAPLAVAHQFVREGKKFGIDLAYAKDHAGITKRITVTNYERLENFNLEQFGGVALDESSILKAHDSKTRAKIVEMFSRTPYRLSCTATPSPNDHMELGNHAEFLGIMSRVEMLATFFVHDGGETSKWRLKGHAEDAFYRWLASWSMAVRKPSDLGYEDDTAFVVGAWSHYDNVLHIVHAESAKGLFPKTEPAGQQERKSEQDRAQKRRKPGDF